MKTIRKERYNLFDIFNIAFMIGLCAITLYPFWYILVYSFNEGRDAALGGVWFWPRVFTFENYKYVIGNSLITNAFFITIIRAISGSVISVAICALAAYAMSHKKLPGRKQLTIFFMIPLFIGGTLVSNYLIIAKLGLLNNFLVYIIPSAFTFFTMVIIRSFFEDLPASLEESARLDGAGHFTIFLRIVLPLSKPVLSAFLFFGVVAHWLDFYSNLLYVTKPELSTLQFILYRIVRESDTSELMKRAVLEGTTVAIDKGRTITTEAIKMTTIVVVTFPILLVYPFFQKYFIKGMLVGAVKE